MKLRPRAGIGSDHGKKRKTTERGLLWWVSILVIALLAILAGYFLGMEHGREDTESSVTPEKIPSEKKDPQPGTATSEVVAPVAPVASQEIIPQKPESPGRLLQENRKRCAGFFAYLSTKDYIRHIQGGAIHLSIS
jgi:hypothetical protein